MSRYPRFTRLGVGCCHKSAEIGFLLSANNMVIGGARTGTHPRAFVAYRRCIDIAFLSIQCSTNQNLGLGVGVLAPFGAAPAGLELTCGVSLSQAGGAVQCKPFVKVEFAIGGWWQE